MSNRPNLAAILYFAAIGLALGAGIGWLALNSWLGIGFLIVGVILLIGLWAELDFLTDIATAVEDSTNPEAAISAAAAP